MSGRTLNTKLLVELIDDIEQNPHLFDMGMIPDEDEFVENEEPPCGSTSCIAGRIMWLRHEQILRWMKERAVLEGGVIPCPDSRMAAYLLGINEDDRYELFFNFDGRLCGTEEERQIVLAKLRRGLKEGSFGFLLENDEEN